MKLKLNFFTFGLDEISRGTAVGMTQKIIKSDLVRKVTETFAARMMTLGIGFLTSVIVARLLGPSGRGLFAVAMTVGAIGSQFGNLGLHASNTYYVAKDRGLLPGLLGNSMAVSFGLGGLLALGGALFFFLFPSLAPARGWVMGLGLLWIPFSLAYLLFQNLLLGIQDIRSFNKVELGIKLISAVLIGSLILLREVSVESVLWAGFSAMVVGLFWVLLKLFKVLKKKPYLSFALLRENISSYGLKAYWSALFSFLVIRIDLLMVQYMKGPEQAGFYNLATNLADYVFMFPVVVGTILFPKLSAMAGPGEKWALTKKTLWASGLMLLAIVFLAGLLSGWLIPLVYGKTFLPSVSAFLWLLPGIYFLGVEVVAVQFLNSIGLPKAVLWSWAAVTLLNVGLNFWMIPRWGMVGASLSSSACYSLIFCFIFAIIRGNLKARPAG